MQAELDTTHDVALLAAMTPAMALALAANFGSVAAWRAEFAARAGSGTGRSSRIALTFAPRSGSLVHRWESEPAANVADAVPIVELDVAAHAEHGAATAAEIDALIKTIDWALAYERYQVAVHYASEPFAASCDEAADAELRDVRRAGVFEQAETMIAGARWRDPAEVGVWANELPRDREVIVYCVYGHEVGRATALRLRAAGLEARFLRGGIDGWKAAGRPLQRKQRESA
ncbi:MAG: rhodanese-like domain-containing protein [Pseudomonadota bacterium]|nr:rhodanese-like domain-containing protein [Pseudomonadota bacterium]